MPMLPRVNVAATWVLARANRSSLNISGAFQHIVTDLYAFLGTVIAAIVILTTGFGRAVARLGSAGTYLLYRAREN